MAWYSFFFLIPQNTLCFDKGYLSLLLWSGEEGGGGEVLGRRQLLNVKHT